MFAKVVCVAMPDVNGNNSITMFRNCNAHVPLPRKQLKKNLLKAITFTNAQSFVQTGRKAVRVVLISWKEGRGWVQTGDMSWPRKGRKRTCPDKMAGRFALTKVPYSMTLGGTLFRALRAWVSLV